MEGPESNAEKGNINKRVKCIMIRWHNHLDPDIKKDYWSRNEDATLFQKHEELGNKWSEIARFLPGRYLNILNINFRTDNAIKNYFYSKLRKHIRKILKNLHKDNVFQMNGIDADFYSSERIYKILKRQNVPYKSISRETISDVILKHHITSRGEKNFGKRNSKRLSTTSKCN
jgi:hypothetical protein